MNTPLFNKSVHGRLAILGLGLLCAAMGTAQVTLTLTPTDHHGYHISCFGGGDGAIDLSVTGGTPPYTYVWSTGATTQDVSNLRSGFISVEVRDAGSGSARADLTLTEPYALRATVEPYLYPSGFNISCHSCYNGSIQVTTLEGVSPYTYAWADGPTTEDRTQLDAGSYTVDITDVNGCTIREDQILLTQPERDDWSKSGNAGTDPSSQFIGTTDNKDVVFKSNGAERLRITAGGLLKASSLANSDSLLLRAGPGGEILTVPSDGFSKFWKTNGNYVLDTGRWFGTGDFFDLVIKTNRRESMRITATGKVGIGTVPPDDSSVYRLSVEDGIVTRDVLVKHGAWPDYVFKETYHLMPLCELRAFVKAHSHLPNLPSAAELDQAGGVALGTHARDLTRTVEEQALYILQLEDRLERIEQRLKVVETSEH